MSSRFNDAGQEPRSRRRGQSQSQRQNHARDAWFADLARDRESLQRVDEFEQEWWSDLDVAFDDVAVDDADFDDAPSFDDAPAASPEVELDLPGTLADRRRSLQQRVPRFGV